MRRVPVACGVFAACALGLALARWRAEPILGDVSFSQIVLGSKGELLRLTLSGEEKYRVRTTLPEVNPRFVEALLLLEDRHYWTHPGLNPVALVRAAFSTWTGGARMGASTLTMQVARLKYGMYTRNWRGKLAQIGAALELELLHSKREILEAYLNLAPYGSNVEGVGAASRIYFGKAPKDLTLDEALALAVVPQRPGERGFATAATRKPYERLRAAWADAHPGSSAAPKELPDLSRRLNALPFRAPHFVNEVLAHNPGVPVLRTSLEWHEQRAWEKRVRAYLKRQAPYGIRNAAALLLNYETMRVEAWVGSADFFDETISGQVDGVLARRSPGSTIKPFAYALALDQGLIHSETVLKDTPSSFGAFDPENFDGQFLGPVSATRALIESRNVPAVYLASRLEKPTLYEFLKDNKIYLPKSSGYYGLSVVLGGAEMSLFEVAGLYAMLARQGRRIPPSLLAAPSAPAVASGLSPEASYIVLDMLTHNEFGKYPREWLSRGFPVAWKTGTSRGFRDAWTVGVAGPYVAAVWLGNFDNRSNPQLVGREMAAPLLFELLDTLDQRKLHDARFLNDLGLNLHREPVCALSGHLPGAHCPARKNALFIPGKSPIKECNVHRELLLSKATGKRFCHPPAAPNIAERKVFEFWPSDFLQLFRQAGLARKSPPPYDASCTDAERSTAGTAPEIVSPKNQVTYNLRMSAGDELNSIPLRAVVDADVRKLYWYAGNRFLGANAPDKPLLWKAEPGDYTLRVVDDFGRADSRQLAVRVAK